MNRSLLIRLLICVFVLGGFFFVYLEKMVEMTQLRLQIPAAARELHALKEDNTRLQYEVDRFENPVHLMELASKPEFGHLKFPKVNEIVRITEDVDRATCSRQEAKEGEFAASFKKALGAFVRRPVEP